MENINPPLGPTEIINTAPIALTKSVWARFKRYAGIGFLVAVGYMDPGNWATDIEAGSRFGYALLWVVLFSCLVAMVLQALCVRLGVASGRDIAQLCRENFSPAASKILWLLAQISIIACDFAEVLGTALALKLLFGLPLSIGVIVTAFDTLILLALQRAGRVRAETIVAVLMLVIVVAFGIETFISQPDWKEMLRGFTPHMATFNDEKAWLIAIGIIGATVMPHNLYLHSSAVSSRKLIPGESAKEDAIRLLTWDTVITLSLALLVNAAILVVAASVFHYSGHTDVAEINDAYHLLAPLLGTGLASIIFGLALFAAGQSSTLTGTMAGQVILQGFLQLKIPGWLQRVITRLIAVIPAWLAITIYGEDCLGSLLVGSQVVLSMQLPFAIVPLIWFCSRSDIMGKWQISFPLKILCWTICGAIISANAYLLYTFFI